MPPLVLVAAAWVAGLILAHHGLVPLGVEPLYLVVLSLVTIAGILLWRKDRTMSMSGVCALALLLAALRYQHALPDLDDPLFVAYYNDRGWVTIDGVVHSYPDTRDTFTYLEIEAKSIEIEGQAHPIEGTVLARASRFPEYRYGDRLRVSGLLQTPQESAEFSYRDYLARQGIYAIVNRPRIEKSESGQGSPFWAALFTVKDRARDTIARLVPDPEASLLQGILLGIRSGIPSDLYDDYGTTGTSHIIVISGTNITFVSGLFALSLGRLVGKRRAYWFVLAGITLYVFLVGADAAVVRAGIMGILLVTAIYLGRRSTAYVALCASAVILTLLNPLALWDVGFQLSFAATLGLILFVPSLERLFERALSRPLYQDNARQRVRFLTDALVLTLAAQILTLPLVATHFGRLSLIAPLANLLILPVQPPILSLGGIAAMAGTVPFLEPLARILAWVPWLCLVYTNTIVRWLAGCPFASLKIDSADTGSWVLAYLAIVLTVWFLSRRPGTTRRIWDSLVRRRSAAFLLGGALALAILAWLAVLQLPDGKLHVAFLDVGQGDAVFITTPAGQQILVDGGPSPTALTSALGPAMPFWDRSLDLVVMTHSDTDHIAGLAEVLDRYRVNGWLDNGQPGEDPLYAECMARLEESSTERQPLHAGDRLDLGSGIVLQVLHPPPGGMVGTEADDNNNSLVLRLVWGEAEFLLAGDIEAEAERLLLGPGQPVAADVLKVAHHGSGGSSTAGFLAAVDPNYTVLSVGADNRFGHPHPDVLDRLAGLANVEVLRTDQQGSIEFATDGQRMWVRTER